jgi:BASS family bile acid:Na+ symporter
MRDVVIHILPVLARIAVVLVAFSIGLGAATCQVTWLWRRPARLARSLLVVLVAVPAMAILLVKTLPLAVPVWAGLILVSLSAGPVAAIRTTRAGNDDQSYAVSLAVTLLLANIPFVPIAFAIEGAVFGRRVSVGVWSVAELILLVQLLPLSLGLLIARRWPAFAPRLLQVTSRLGNGLLLVIALVIVVALARQMVAIGAPGLLAALGLAVFATVLGHLLGGPDRDQRLVLATLSAMRFPALAILLATTLRGGTAILPVVMAYTLISAVTTAVYRAVTRAVGRRQPTAPPLTPAPAH